MWPIPVAAGLLSSLALLSPAPAQAWCRTTTKTPITGNACVEQGLPLRWERQCITFTVQSEDPAVRDAIDRSFTTWSDVLCDGQPIGLALRQTEETAVCELAEYNSDAPNMNAILVVDDWAEHEELPPDAFAVTLVWNLKDTGEIVDADMLLNPTLGDLTICDAQCANKNTDIDIQNVVTHEAGHFLGLAHSDVEGSTMSSTAPVGQTEKRDLIDDDREGLCAIYGELPQAQCSAKAFVPRHGFSVECREPPSSNTSCTLSVAAVGAAGGGANRAWPFGLLSIAAALLAVRGGRRRTP